MQFLKEILLPTRAALWKTGCAPDSGNLQLWIILPHKCGQHEHNKMMKHDRLCKWQDCPKLDSQKVVLFFIFLFM